MRHADVVICGAGIAGVSAAYHLAQCAAGRIILIDERPPLTLTSDVSSECYRNWWPGPADVMVRLMNRSIDLLEDLARESGNIFNLNRRGYVYVTAADETAFVESAKRTAALGVGPLRIHAGPSDDYEPSPPEGFEGQPEGADLILDPWLIRKHFPYLTRKARALLHVRRCGWMSAQQLGMWMLEQARAAGVELVKGRMTAVACTGGRIEGVSLLTGAGTERIATQTLVNAAGPMVGQVGRMMDLELPVINELHAKLAFHDGLGVVPREAPMLIWSDPQTLDWSEEERQLLAASEETRLLLGRLPEGAHLRPEGGRDSRYVIMLWSYQAPVMAPVWPPPFEPSYAEITLRGLCTMIPGLRAYLARLPRPHVDGGYYTKTRENLPLIGPLPLQGAHVLGALSGFGIMAACAAGELLAAHVTGGPLPSYAPWFAPSRYEDAGLRDLLQSWKAAGEL